MGNADERGSSASKQTNGELRWITESLKSDYAKKVVSLQEKVTQIASAKIVCTVTCGKFARILYGILIGDESRTPGPSAVGPACRAGTSSSVPDVGQITDRRHPAGASAVLLIHCDQTRECPARQARQAGPTRDFFWVVAKKVGESWFTPENGALREGQLTKRFRISLRSPTPRL
jgi:hypothetical protein